jgi:hypothetical protein
MLAVAVLFGVYGQGLDTWFEQDDFAWLSLRDEVRDFPSFLTAMFAPKAQGTIRPWSERTFFMGFRTLFDLDALPYRILVFGTQALNLWLLVAVTRRITGSTLAAGAAAVFWTVNAALGVPLAWTSAYNQILCPAFLLGAFYFLLRWLDSGRARDYLLQALIFVLGFGALEHNIVYPALAAAWVVLAGRARALVSILPLGVISAAYLALHNAVSPKAAATGPYALHTDPASLWATLAWYFLNFAGGLRMQGLELPPWLKTAGAASAIVVGAGLVVFLLARLRNREWTALFPLAWFAILLAPVLPLRDHLSDYYLVMPALGLSMLGGWAFSGAMRTGWAGRIPAAGLAALYLATTVPVGRETVAYYHHISNRVRNLVLGVRFAHGLHPGKVILLSGVDSDLFWSGINDKPFRLDGIRDVFLTPGSEANIQPYPALGDPAAFVLPPAQTLRVLGQGRAVVYDAAGERLRNITRTYSALARSSLRPTLASRIDVGHRLYEQQLGAGWEPATPEGYRWMGKRATVRLGVPERGGKLVVEGYCTAEQASGGGVELTASIAGNVLLKKRIETEGAFLAESGPLERPGPQGEIEVLLQVSRVVRPAGEDRELGLVFGKLSLR